MKGMVVMVDRLDPRKRPWYWRALTRKTANVVSTPYRDAASSGYVRSVASVVYVCGRLMECMTVV